MEDNNPLPSAPPPPPQTTHPELSYDTIPLNTPATEIRLLQLLPSADFSSPLHCRLYNTSISSPAPFKALSYAWGSDDKTHLIYVDSDTSHEDESAFDVLANDNGHQTDPTAGTAPISTPKRKFIIRITSSLDSCLRHLRAIHHRDDPLTEMTLWIDQLCIAQLNPHEKAVQVGLMTQVYSRAEQVLIWLGPETDGSGVVMDALAELGKEFEGSGVDFSNAEMIDTIAEGLRAGVGFGASLGEGTDTTCGGAKVAETTDHDGDVAGDGGGVGVGVDVGAGMGEEIANTKVLDAATTTCNTNKANESTGKTIMKVVEEGAATLARLWASGELQSLFRRPWFTRVWVVQEACLCDDTVFVCGTRAPVDYDILGAICMCMIYAIREFERKGGYAPEWDGVSPISTDAELAGVRMPRDTARGLSRLMHQVTQSFSGRHCRLQQATEEEEGDNLFTLLVDMYANAHSCREAKLHRDRIYALLGVAADVDELGIKPDYSSQTGTAQILTEVAKAIISKTKDGFPVELLSYSQFPKTSLDDQSDDQLPTWVPDWRSGLQPPFYDDLDDDDDDDDENDPNPEGDNARTHRNAFMACGSHRSVDTAPTTSTGTLGLRGYLVGIIEEVGCMAYVVRFATEPRLAEEIEFFENLDRFWELSKQKDEPIYESSARREEALWRVPVGDMMHDWGHVGHHRAKPEFALEYRSWRRTLEQYQALGFDMTAPDWRNSVDEDARKRAVDWAVHALREDGGKAYGGVMVEMAQKRLYLTRKGYMGMGPSDMEPGDVVVVFPGARIPFVLRLTAEENTFTYVGDAYCDGIMDGEITRREERRDFFLV